MAVKGDRENYEASFLQRVLSVPGLDVAVGTIDKLMDWGSSNSLWIFPMATSCCGIEFMAAAASRVDLDRMGTIVRGSPRHGDVMVVAGTITVKMAPRVRKLWDQMPEPKWCIAMGSCAISGDFYRDIYSVVPGVDTLIPVDVYVPGCPPNPTELMVGLQRLQEKIHAQREGTWVEPEVRPQEGPGIRPDIGRLVDPHRDPALSHAQMTASRNLGLNGNEHRSADATRERFVDLKRLRVGKNVAVAARPAPQPEPVDAPVEAL